MDKFLLTEFLELSEYKTVTSHLEYYQSYEAHPKYSLCKKYWYERHKSLWSRA